MYLNKNIVISDMDAIENKQVDAHFLKSSSHTISTGALSLCVSVCLSMPDKAKIEQRLFFHFMVNRQS